VYRKERRKKELPLPKGELFKLFDLSQELHQLPLEIYFFCVQPLCGRTQIPDLPGFLYLPLQEVYLPKLLEEGGPGLLQGRVRGGLRGGRGRGWGGLLKEFEHIPPGGIDKVSPVEGIKKEPV
jgi:hypothetical protein